MSVDEQIEELLNDLESEDTYPMNEGITHAYVNGNLIPITSGGCLIPSHGVHTSFVYDAPVVFCLTK